MTGQSPATSQKHYPIKENHLKHPATATASQPISAHHTNTDQHLREVFAHEFMGDHDNRHHRPAGRRAKISLVRAIRRGEKQWWKKEVLDEIA